MLTSQDPASQGGTGSSVAARRAEVSSGAPADQPVLDVVHAQLYAAESSAHWSRYNSQLLANFGLLAATTIGATGAFVHAHPHVITIIGGEISVIWLLFAVQGGRRLSLASRVLRGQTAVAAPDAGTQATRTSGGSLLQRNWWSLNWLAWALPTLAVFGWVLLFLSKPGV